MQIADPKQIVEETGKAAKNAERFPWGTTIVISLVTSVVMYVIMNASINRANERAVKWENNYYNLVHEVLEKNGIIRDQERTIELQKDLITQSDSALQQIRPIVNKILKHEK